MRDVLLGRDIKDLDLYIESDAYSLAKKFSDLSAFKLFQPNKRYRVYRCISNDRSLIVDFQEGGNLKEFLGGRDFTINALAVRVNEFRNFLVTNNKELVIDYSSGIQDIQAGKLKACFERAFEEDPVRALRLVRHTIELDFFPDRNTLEASRKTANLILTASKEMLFQELIALAEADFALAISWLEKVDLICWLFQNTKSADFAKTVERFQAALKLFSLKTAFLNEERKLIPYLKIALFESALDEPKAPLSQLEWLENRRYKKAKTLVRKAISCSESINFNHILRALSETWTPVLFAACVIALGRLSIEKEEDLLNAAVLLSYGDSSNILLNGNDVILLKVRHGPEVGFLLKKQRFMFASGIIRDRDSAIAWVIEQAKKE